MKCSLFSFVAFFLPFFFLIPDYLLASDKSSFQNQENLAILLELNGRLLQSCELNLANLQSLPERTEEEDEILALEQIISTKLAIQAQNIESQLISNQITFYSSVYIENCIKMFQLKLQNQNLLIESKKLGNLGFPIIEEDNFQSKFTVYSKLFKNILTDFSIQIDTQISCLDDLNSEIPEYSISTIKDLQSDMEYVLKSIKIVKGQQKQLFTTYMDCLGSVNCEEKEETKNKCESLISTSAFFDNDIDRFIKVLLKKYSHYHKDLSHSDFEEES